MGGHKQVKRLSEQLYGQNIFVIFEVVIGCELPCGRDRRASKAKVLPCGKDHGELGNLQDQQQRKAEYLSLIPGFLVQTTCHEFRGHHAEFSLNYSRCPGIGPH